MIASDKHPDVSFLRFSALLLIGLGLMAGGCSPVSEPKEGAAIPSRQEKGAPDALFPGTFVYGRNKEHLLKLEHAPNRMVSLSPALTETVFALKADQKLAAVTSACDFPPEAKRKPNIGGYPHSLEKILAFKPDLVLGDSSLNQKTLEALERIHVPVFYADSARTEDVERSISDLGSLTEQKALGERLALELKVKLVPLPLKTSEKPPKVLMAYGASPIFTTGPGTVIDEVIRASGGVNVIASRGGGDKVTPEQVIALQPEVIICSPELIPQLKALPGFAQGVPAIRNNRFYSQDNSAPLVRPGPRLGEAKEALQKFLHP